MSTTEWITPRAFIYIARQVLGDIDLDPASSDAAQRNVEARHYYTPYDDGLEQRWFGRVWIAPPNGRSNGFASFTGKLINEWRAGRVTEAICLVPNSTDTAWFHALMDAVEIWTAKTGRISFEARDRKSTTPANGQCFFYLGQNPKRFARCFRPLGPTFGRLDA